MARDNAGEQPGKDARVAPGQAARGRARRVGPARLKVYAEYLFQVVYADWFDRLAAPIRFYYDDRAMRGWLERAHLGRTAISPTGLFGWRAYGERS